MVWSEDFSGKLFRNADGLVLVGVVELAPISAAFCSNAVADKFTFAFGLCVWSLLNKEGTERVAVVVELAFAVCVTRPS